MEKQARPSKKSAPDRPPPRRRALSTGNGRFKYAAAFRLPGTRRDAKNMRPALADPDRACTLALEIVPIPEEQVLEPLAGVRGAGTRLE